MDIEKHIKEYLIEHQAVSMEGIGTLKLIKNAAKIETTTPSSRRIVPPSLELKLVNDNASQSGLIEFIELREFVSQNEIRNNIALFSNSILNAIKEGNSFKISDLGEFYSTDRHFILFTSNFTSPFYISTLQLPDIDIDWAEPLLKTEQQTPKRRLKSGIIIVGILLALIFIIAIFYHFNRNNKFSSPNRTDTITLKTEHNPQRTDTLEAKNRQYYIVVGSFNNRYNAEKLSEELMMQNYAPQIIKTANDMFRVSLGSFATEAQAYEALQKILKTDPRMQIWIYTE